jgi:hypothetical protein
MAVLVYIDSLWLKLGLILLLVLWFARDRTRHLALQAQDPASLTLNDKTGGIELYQQGKRRQFTRFRLFANRWFLILQLRDDESSENLLLTPQGFSSVTEFLRVRYQLMNMSKKPVC